MNSDFFQNKLAPLLNELGFNITETGENQTAKAYLNVGAVKVPFFIKYTEDAIGITGADVKVFFAELNVESTKTKGLKGLYVVSHFYTEDAFKSAEELGIALSTYEELLNSTVNFTDYLNDIIFDYEQSPESSLYVYQNVRNLKAEFVPLETEFENWIEDDTKNILFLLGESGLGKTIFSSRFSYVLAKNFLGEPTGIPAPIYIQLKHYKKSMSIANLIIFHLFNVHNLQLRSFNVFSRLLREGRILLILDGFDEYINDPMSYEAELFLQELFALGSGKAKIALTSHPDYFLYNPDEATNKNIHSSKIFERFINKTNYSLLYLRPFNSDQIKRYVKVKSGIENNTFLKNLSAERKLKEIAKFPVLLNLLLELDIKKPKNKTEVFNKYIQKWLDDDNWMVHLTSEGKSVLAQELSWLLWDTNAHSIYYTSLPERLSHYVKKEFKQKRDNDYLLIDIQETPFMINNGGMCSFIHESFRDYFVAKHITRLMEEGDRAFLNRNYVSRQVVEFLCEQSGLEKVLDFFNDVLSDTKNRKQRARAIVALYLLKDFVLNNEDFFTTEEIDIIKNEINFREYSLMGVDLSYANITGIDFNGASLPYSVFQHTGLFNANFENSDLSKTILEKADLRKSNLKNANLINSDMSFAYFNEADLSGAICVEAKMIEVTLSGADCTDAKFLQSNLHAALGINVKMKRANFNKADLQNADFSNSSFDNAVFTETNLNHTILQKSSLKKASVNNCFIWGAELMDCNFEGASLNNLDMSNGRMAYSSFKKVSFKNVNLTLADLRDTDFKEADFVNVNFDKADIRGAKFENCSFDKNSEKSFKLAFNEIKKINAKTQIKNKEQSKSKEENKSLNSSENSNENKKENKSFENGKK